jgi:hypothetical protein
MCLQQVPKLWGLFKHRLSHLLSFSAGKNPFLFSSYSLSGHVPYYLLVISITVIFPVHVSPLKVEAVWSLETALPTRLHGIISFKTTI